MSKDALHALQSAKIAFENMAIDFVMGTDNLAISWPDVADEQRTLLADAIIKLEKTLEEKS